MVIRPVIGILVRCGLPFGRFADICRSVYVEIASNEFGIDGRPTNTSRIALLTGLSRTRVKRELDLLAATAPMVPADSVRPVSRMLMAWHTDPAFLDRHGKPLDLSPDGPRHSFQQLYEKYSGKVVPSTAMLKELLSVGAVRTTADGSLRVLTRSYTPRQTDPGALMRVAMAVRDIATTGSYNLYRKKERRARFERFATSQLIPLEEIDNFADFLDAEGQAFLERADDWLMQREVQDSTEEVVRIGVGVYQISPGDAESG